MFKAYTFSIFIRLNVINSPQLVKNPRTKIKELINSISISLSPHMIQLIQKLPLEILISNFKSFFLNSIMNTLIDPEDHVQHKVPVVMTEANE